MSYDEGYIKYDIEWTPGPAAFVAAARALDAWRRPLFDAGLIGVYEDLGIGYGNLSIRCGEPGQFLISGTQTGERRRSRRFSACRRLPRAGRGL